MMDKDDSSWKYPGEYGRVAAWVKRTRRDLELEKDIYGHPPSVVFETRQEKFIEQETIEVPHGFSPPPTGHFYVTDENGTPQTKRHLSFTPAATEQVGGWNGVSLTSSVDSGDTDRPDRIEIPNPEYITDKVFFRLKKWVHNWILSRIPDRHQHLVSDVAKGDLDDLFVKCRLRYALPLQGE